MPATFDVERFEHVAATKETALLRVAGRWRSDQRERLSPPMLVVDDGKRTHRLAALPGPDDAAPSAGPEAQVWRAAFSAPSELIENARRVFALDAGQNVVAALPRPAEGRRQRPAEAAREEGGGGRGAGLLDRERLEDAERRAVDRRRGVRELEQRLDGERSARVEAERRAQAEARARQRVEAEIGRQGSRVV